MTPRALAMFDAPDGEDGEDGAGPFHCCQCAEAAAATEVQSLLAEHGRNLGRELPIAIRTAIIAETARLAAALGLLHRRPGSFSVH